jgi:hypothetical protein
LQPGGKSVLSVGSSICGNLTGTPADARGLLSGTPTRVPFKTGESCLKPAKNTKHKHTSNLTQNIRTQHSPCRDGPRGPPERPNKAPPRARSASLEGSRSLERTPPRSRVPATLEQAPPRSRVPASLERAPPRSRLPHGRTCSCTRVRAFNALTQQSRAITRLGITPRCCSANSLGGAHPCHCGGLCDEASVSSVTLRRPL